MSIINSTLIIQAVHFLIAYLLIKFFFFRYAHEAIHAEDSLQEALVQNVQRAQIQVAQKEEELKQRWLDARVFFSDHIPLFKKRFIRSQEYSGVSPSTQQHALQSEKSAAYFVDLLMQKVRRDN